MISKRICARYDNGKCRLIRSGCHAVRERGDSKAIMYVKEVSCYWFTRDIEEGKRVLEKPI